MQPYEFYYNFLPPFFPFAHHNENQLLGLPQTNIDFNFFQKKNIIQKIQLLNQKCQSLQKQNQTLKAQLQQNCKQTEKIESTEQKQQKHKIQQINHQGILEIRRIIKRRRVGSGLVRNYNCPYHNCKKGYASELALNLHMRKKHNGGTKRQRKQLLKLIIEAELKGTQTPKINLKFPPNYIQEKNKLLLNCGIMEDINLRPVQK